ncbi:MAG TPA: class E sortase [Capillimicrobium sp.]|nr:class E sortase [Capillimicrobium sp.]
MRGFLRWLSTVLMLAGVMLIGDAIVAVTWQEPVSAFLAQRSQNALEDDLDRLRAAGPTPLEVKALESLPSRSRRLAYVARRTRERLQPGDAIGRIVMPSLDRDYVMVNGVSSEDLRRGPGIYDDTPMPGEGSTTGIAGHRTTYLAPFRDIDELDPGDVIELEMPYGDFTYVVQRTKIVEPTDLSVIDDVGYERIVLTACHPLYSAAQRIAVFARLAEVEPARRISDLGADARRR